MIIADWASATSGRPTWPQPWLDFPGMHDIMWKGWDGSEWHLNGCTRDLVKGVALGRRVRGLHFGPLEDMVVDSAGIDGASLQGYRAATREVFMTVRVYCHTSSQDWIEWDRKWWTSMLPPLSGFDGEVIRDEGTLTVTQPDGSSRYIKLAPSHKGGDEFDVDPSRRGYATYGVTLNAYRPFWRGETVQPRSFTNGSTQSGFFGGAAGGYGPPFVLGGTSTLAAATIDNPGEEPAWPVWRITGPCTSAKVGVPGQMATITAKLDAGQTIVIDTDPLAQTFRDEYGVTLRPPTIGLSGPPFAPIMPGKDRALATEMVGTGGISVSLTPLYHRAW